VKKLVAILSITSGSSRTFDLRAVFEAFRYWRAPGLPWIFASRRFYRLKNCTNLRHLRKILFYSIVWTEIKFYTLTAR